VVDGLTDNEKDAVKTLKLQFVLYLKKCFRPLVRHRIRYSIVRLAAVFPASSSVFFFVVLTMGILIR